MSEAESRLLEKLSPVVGGRVYRLPEPALEPHARLQRRLAWRPELHLFFRSSDLSGKRLFSFFPPGADSTVYTLDEWTSDTWDGTSYGRDFDFSKPFFEQFLELRRVVPQPGTAVLHDENSEYVNNTFHCKSCYLIAGGSHDDSCYYGSFINHSSHCVDNCFIQQCELCYDCIDCGNCYGLQHGWNCTDCSNSTLLHNCRSCRNCFGSVNLARREYVFFNTQLSEEDYCAELDKLALDTYSGREKALERFERHRYQYPYRFLIGESNDDVTGNVINNSKNCDACFDVTNLQDCSHCVWFHRGTDCMDCYSWGLPAELCYECVGVGDHAFRNLFCSHCYGCSDILYSHQMRNCKDSFGCVSLRRKQYCILNKQYSKSDYETLLGRILSHMSQTGEWGQFFPPSVSPLDYNGSAAFDHFPLDKDSARRAGFRWHSGPAVVASAATADVLPDAISEVDDSICGTALNCSATGRSFRITKPELQFYREHGIPLPRLSWEQRHLSRIRRRLPWSLWDRSCDQCGRELQTAFSPTREERIFCTECYAAAIG